VETTLSVAQITRDFYAARFFCERSHSHQKRSQKRKWTIFGNTKQVPGVPGLHFVPWHRGNLCLVAAAPVTGAAADEYNLNVVDCNTSVTVARRSSISVSGGPGGYPQPQEANVKWFSVASPWPAGNFTENSVSPLLLRARGPTRVNTERLAEREPLLYRLGSELNRIV
jgi:hypothetical protein